MEAASNPGIVPLAEALLVEMRKCGFGTYCLTCTARLMQSKVVLDSLHTGS